MYNPPHFQEQRPEELERIINDFPLGALVYATADGWDAEHLPFLYRKDEASRGKLIAHVARKNSIWQRLPADSEVMAIFRGAESYISPNWCPSKHETHRHVPTWNYQVVHVHGRIRFVEDPKFLRGVVGLLTRIHETRANEAKPWSMSDAEKDYIDAQIAAIVGLEIDVTRIAGKSKLSQNREPRDRAGAIEELRRRGEDAVAQAMEKARQ